MIETLTQNERLAKILGFLIVAAMMATLMVSIVQIMEILYPEWQGRQLVPLAFLLALEAMYIHRARREYVFPDLEWFVFHVTEWIVILLVIKVVILSGQGFEEVVNEARNWRDDFWNSFFNTGYNLAVISMMIIWFVSLAFANAMVDLTGDERWLRIEEDSGTFIERYSVRQRLADLILTVGVVMILLTSLLRLNLEQQWLQIPQVRIGVANILIYFLLGLVLLSLTQLSILRIRWLRNGVEISSQLTSRWVLYSFLFLCGLIIMAFILPTGYTIGLLSLLNMLVKIILGVIAVIIFVLSLPYYFLTYLLGFLMGQPQERMQMPQLVPPQSLVETPTPGEPVAWIEMIKSFGFWFLMIGTVIFSIYYVLRNRGEQLAVLRSKAVFAWLIGFWDALRSWLGNFNQQVAAAVRSGYERIRKPGVELRPRRTWRYINVHKLPPRERVRFYYLAMEKKARESGVPRHKSQTPYEYANELESRLHKKTKDSHELEAPEADVEALTHQFVAARYSDHEVTQKAAERGNQYWSRIRKYFRKITRL